MRTFIISLVLLVAVTAFVIADIAFMQDYCADLLALADSLPMDEDSYEEGKETLCQISEKWKSKEKMIAYLMDYREVDRVNVALSDMQNAFGSGDFQQYTVYSDEFRHAVQRLCDISKVTLENIF